MALSICVICVHVKISLPLSPGTALSLVVDVLVQKNISVLEQGVRKCEVEKHCSTDRLSKGSEQPIFNFS